ncbi:MAG: hypothetical protein P8188_17300 [Gemmatimonadota bacterium]
MSTPPTRRRWPRHMAPLGLIALCAACTETPLSTPVDPADDMPQGMSGVEAPRSPLEAVPEGLYVARSHVAGELSFDNRVSVSSAPGPDGILRTPDDLRFDASWTGPRTFSFPSPSGDLWESLGVRFQLIDGGVAFTNSGGCLGSQRPSPYNNWAGGIRTIFLDDQGRPTPVSAVSIDVVNPPVTLRALASDGSELARRSLEGFRGPLTVHDVGPIDRVELTGDFWCISDEIRWNALLLVEVDVKPGSARNPVNLRGANGVLPVAVLSTPDFDARTIDHETLVFEGATETHVQKRTGEVRRHEEDVDGDGDIDLVMHVRLGDTNLDASTTEGVLLGRTFDGQDIYGRDRVTVLSTRSRR